MWLFCLPLYSSSLSTLATYLPSRCELLFVESVLKNIHQNIRISREKNKEILKIR